MELVDPNVIMPDSKNADQGTQSGTKIPITVSSSRREGWGTAEATEMITNNLFYITAKVHFIV